MGRPAWPVRHARPLNGAAPRVPAVDLAPNRPADRKPLSMKMERGWGEVDSNAPRETLESIPRPLPPERAWPPPGCLRSPGSGRSGAYPPLDGVRAVAVRAADRDVVLAHVAVVLDVLDVAVHAQQGASTGTGAGFAARRDGGRRPRRGSRRSPRTRSRSRAMHGRLHPGRSIASRGYARRPASAAGLPEWTSAVRVFPEAIACAFCPERSTSTRAITSSARATSTSSQPSSAAAGAMDDCPSPTVRAARKARVPIVTRRGHVLHRPIRGSRIHSAPAALRGSRLRPGRAGQLGSAALSRALV